MDTSLSQLKLDSLLSVDIYRGIKDLQNLKDSRIEKNHVAYVNSGIYAVFEILQTHLINSGLAENILCEYSLISSTLDPFNKGKLDCCAMVYGTSEFKDLVENFYLKSIEITDNEIGISIYQHPNFLYDIDKVGAKSTITYKPATLGEYNKLEIVDEQSCDTKYTKVDIDTSSSNSLWIQAFHLPRPYDEMIKEAKDFYQRKKNKPNTWLTLEEVQERLHAYCHYNISCKRSKESYYISFPIFGSIASNQLPKYLVLDPTSSAKNIPLQGIGACFIYVEVNSQIEENQFKTIVNKISYEIGDLIRFISANYLFNVGLNLREIVVKESLKSAKAAIMSRNMSHNLGSHVMFYIKQKLQSVSKIVDSKVLDNIIPGKIPDIAAVEAAIKANNGIELPFLVGLGRFINYLQERQDYIATIATDYIPANSTISFKDFIYDELKPELRYQRHHSKSDDAGWKSGNLLLDYIAYSEGYRSCDKIEILFGEFNGSSPVKDTNPDKDFQKLREFNIAVPGGVIGRQALFSIFENIIRNAAKHSERRSDNKLVLQLSLLEKDSVLFTEDEFRAKRNDDKVDYDKCGLDLKKLYADYFDRYHFLRIKVDMPNPDSVIDTLVDNLADPYIDDNGAMKETTKGLKEMRISAAWLRGKSIDTEIPADEPPAISIYSEPYKGDESKVTISYILCIPKPCRVAFVLNIADFETLNIAEFNQSKNLNKLANLNKLFSPYGCKVFNQEQLSDDKVIEEIANYEIVCMSENDKDICSRISSRYIIDDVTNENQLKKNDLLTNLINSIENTDYTNEKNKKDAIEDSIGSVYDTWFKITYNDVTPKLVVADGKAVQNNKRENGHLSSDSNVILTTTGKVGDEDNASTQNSENANDASVTLSERIVTKDDVKGAVVYSTHFKGLSSKSEGPDGYNTWLQDAICIESVTGNNSTARLIRQDEWTKEWKTKILSAGMARVAIFDERIFSSFVSRESKAKIDDVLSQINTIKSEANKDSWKDKFIELGIQPRHAKNLTTANADKTREIIEKTYGVEYQYDVAQKNHERRIWAFDIKVPEKVNNIVEIVGYNVCIDDCVGEYKEHKSDAIISIAKISYNDESKIFEVTLCDDKMVFTKGNSNIFDYITIHQGVLDKIYTAFGIKDNAIEKHKVTHALHSCFSKHVTPGDKKAFLPNFIIHSGRSKPSAADLPQRQPFVQFAAVDHAVKDCKYTLVELLATAHYEKGNNNN